MRFAGSVKVTWRPASVEMKGGSWGRRLGVWGEGGHGDLRIVSVVECGVLRDDTYCLRLGDAEGKMFCHSHGLYEKKNTFVPTKVQSSGAV